jgi:peptidoglycan/LPS O-acetylase OafA/YrhL
MDDNGRAFRKEGLFALALYTATLFPSIWITQKFHHGWWRPPLAIAPILPCLLFVRALLRFYGRCDELQMRIHLQALAFAFGCTAILTLTYGFLQNVGFPNINFVWVWPLMGSLWAIGAAVAQRKYR